MLRAGCQKGPTVRTPVAHNAPERGSRPMRRARGQVIAHGSGKWLLRLYVGLDAQGKRIYTSHSFRGTGKEARQELTKLVRAKDTHTLIVPSQQLLKDYAE